MSDPTWQTVPTDLEYWGLAADQAVTYPINIQFGMESHGCTCFISAPPCSHCTDCGDCSPYCFWCGDEHDEPKNEFCPNPQIGERATELDDPPPF